MELFDVTIIGGGPTGLFTAFYSGMRAMKTKVIDAKAELGGKVKHFYPRKRIYDIGGIPNILGEDLIEDLKKQAFTFEPTIVQNETVEGLERLENGTFKLTSQEGGVHYTRTVILALGSGAFDVEKLDHPDAEKYEGQSLFYGVKDPRVFAGKHVVISGGGNASLDWAAELSGVCDRLILAYRGEAFRGHEYLVDKVMKSDVEIRFLNEIEDLLGANDRLRQITLRNRKTGESETIDADAVIVNHGFKFGLGSIENWGLEIKDGCIVVDDKMQTTIPGIYAAGDIALYPHKLHLIASGFHEGPVALNSAKAYLDPEALPQAMVSTHHEKFIGAEA